MPTVNHPIVGRVQYEVLSGGRLKILTSQSIDTAHIPQLAGVETYGGKGFSGNVPFYAPAIPQLKAAFEMVEELGLENKVIFWAGSYVPRLKRGGSTPSNHSFGTAFDINSVQNPFKKKPAPKGAYGSVIELLPIFRALGFECGADWQNTPDGMHFEIKRLLSGDQIEAAKLAIRKAYGKAVAPPKLEAVPVAPRLIINGKAFLPGKAKKVDGSWYIALGGLRDVGFVVQQQTSSTAEHDDWSVYLKP